MKFPSIKQDAAYNLAVILEIFIPDTQPLLSEMLLQQTPLHTDKIITPKSVFPHLFQRTCFPGGGRGLAHTVLAQGDQLQLSQ